MVDKPGRRITVSARPSDEELLDQIVSDGHARSVSAAFRYLCDAYRKMQSDQTLVEVTRRVDHDEVLRGVGLADEDSTPPSTTAPRWTALVADDD